jgi:hypothetical protein
VVPESHAFSAQAIQIWGTQKAGAQMGHEVSPPLINNDEKDVLASRHWRTSKQTNEALLELPCFIPMKVMRQLSDEGLGCVGDVRICCTSNSTRLVPKHALGWHLWCE